MAARLYMPRVLHAGPPILFFHGGGFISCGLETHDALCRRLAAASGLRVISVSYRLAPEHPAPAQVEDAIAACRWVLGSPPELGCRTEQIIVSGDSAGGYLAVRCGITLNRQSTSVVAQLLFYPLISIDFERGPGGHSPGWVEQRANALIRSHLGSKPYPSLMSLDVANLPKTIVVGGRILDPVYAANKAFVAMLTAADVPVEHIVLPRLFHGALNVDRISQTASNAVEISGKLLI
jgi:acetyl esterase